MIGADPSAYPWLHQTLLKTHDRPYQTGNSKRQDLPVFHQPLLSYISEEIFADGENFAEQKLFLHRQVHFSLHLHPGQRRSIFLLYLIYQE